MSDMIGFQELNPYGIDKSERLKQSQREICVHIHQPWSVKIEPYRGTLSPDVSHPGESSSVLTLIRVVHIPEFLPESALHTAKRPIELRALWIRIYMLCTRETISRCFR